MVKFSKKLFPTHATRAFPHFKNVFISPTLKHNQLFPDRPYPAPAPATTRRAATSDILNFAFVSSYETILASHFLSVEIPGTSFFVFITQLDRFDVDIDTVNITLTTEIKDLCNVPASKRENLQSLSGVRSASCSS